MKEQLPKKRRRGRPPKDQAQPSETRVELIRSGMEILTEKGFAATGIDEILRRVGVPKGSFYHYFKSKDAFGCELIDAYNGFFLHKLSKFLCNEQQQPLQRLGDFIQDSIEGMARFDYTRGCLVGNLGQEMGALPESFRERLIVVLEQWQDRVADCLLAGQQAGQVAPHIDCHQAAYVFWTGWEGAVLRAKLERSPHALQAFAQFFLTSLK